MRGRTPWEQGISFSWRTIGRDGLAAESPDSRRCDSREITLHGSIESGLGAVGNIASPPGPVDAIERHRRDDIGDATDRRSIERDVVRETVHEADRAAVHRDHGDI